MKTFEMKKCAATVVIAVLIMFMPSFAFAGIFGGKILFAVPCTCSGNYLLTIGPPRPATLVFQPGISVSYLFHQVYRAGAWALGNYSSGGSCLMYAGITCVSVPNNGTITKIGTSR